MTKKLATTPRAARAKKARATTLRRRQRLGKYRVLRKINEGGFAEVYEAEDTIEGIRVALRVPRPDMVDEQLLESFRKEVRLVARLEHPNVLPVKSADVIDGVFVIATLLGIGTVEDALAKRMTVSTVLDYAEQLLRAVAHAHEQGVIHCDVKPDNVIVFPEGRLRLTDFGIAKAALSTMASGSGTIGYLAPEQALGRPSVRSDVFSTGLVIWRMLAGEVPEWPFEWPLPGLERVRKKVHPDLIALLRKSLDVDQRRRYKSAEQMLAVFLRLKAARKLLPPQRSAKKGKTTSTRHWRDIRFKQFQQRFRKELALGHECGKCHGPMGEAMKGCPWCGHTAKRFSGESKWPARCTRCGRGRKLDWKYCAWCYGGGFATVSEREYVDKRYSARCAAPGCTRRDLMPFSRYCPWCRAKVQKRWTFAGADGRCKKCSCGVASDFWKWCPWCVAPIRKH